MQRREFIKATTLALTGAATGRPRPVKALSQPRVVVVGGGFAGAACALDLRRLNPGIQVTLIDADERYVTCPMSNAVIVGWRDLDSITVSRRGLEQAGVRFLHDRVTAIDPQRHSVHVASGATLAYERLVVAPGIRFLWNRPQGYDEAAAQIMPHAWQAGAQTQILAAQLRSMDAGGVVAISVPSGPMRCPPGPFERATLIAAYLKQNKPRAKVLIFDANNHFPRQDMFTDVWKSLYPGMVEWIPVTQDGAVTRVDPKKMTLYTSHGAHRVAVANIIPPQAPALLAAQAGLASDHGWCPVIPASFESRLCADVHVIGDACIADPMPKSASAARNQARQCARSIVAALDGREPPEAELDSVCYSMLARDQALSIHARFRLADGVIHESPPADVAKPLDTPSAEAANAQAWYKSIVAESFGEPS